MKRLSLSGKAFSMATSDDSWAIATFVFFGRRALSEICLLIEGNFKSLSLFVTWKGSIGGEISCSVIVHLLQSFRMSLAGERVSNYCWVYRVMFATTALSTSVTPPSWALVVSASCYVGNVEAKSVKAFSSSKPRLVFERTRSFK